MPRAIVEERRGRRVDLEASFVQGGAVSLLRLSVAAVGMLVPALVGSPAEREATAAQAEAVSAARAGLGHRGGPRRLRSSSCRTIARQTIRQCRGAPRMGSGRAGDR
eukprot:scaffold43469_cov58-Phaeocystis_antarctica.AAC.3